MHQSSHDGVAADGTPMEEAASRMVRSIEETL
jgi:hypothetical protein